MSRDLVRSVSGDPYSMMFAELHDNSSTDYTDVKKRLGKYKWYLREMREYIKNNPDKIKNTRYDHPVYPGEAWIRSEELLDENIKHVWEVDNDGRWKKFNEKDGIQILERDQSAKVVKLKRRPKTTMLVIKPDLRQIQRQLEAMHDLTGKATEAHRPLLDLFLDRDEAYWPSLVEGDVEKWHVLDDDGYEGVEMQREFVRKALETPDFAFLEGPPGSGKTTVLCELVQQMIDRGKRVLITASTHVAVDNLIEKLDASEDKMRDLVLVRMGQKDKLAKNVQKWHHSTFTEAKRKSILDSLEKKGSGTTSSKMLEVMLRREGSVSGACTMEDIIRDSTNVVCGTPIGILAHPDLKDGSRRFDMLIIDEASKTTFQEFLVPAMYADRWVIVGDTRQLDPYTDDEKLGGLIGSTLEDRRYPDVCLDAFLAYNGKDTAIPTRDDSLRGMYRIQCGKLEVPVHDADTSRQKPGGVIIGSPGAILGMEPREGLAIRGLEELEEYWKGLRGDAKVRARDRHRMWKKRQLGRKETWGSLVAWKIKQDYMAQRDRQREQIEDGEGYADDEDGGHDEKYKREIDRLMPSEDLPGVDLEQIRKDMRDIQSVAYPSILESIQYGFLGGSRPDTTMGRGMEADAFGARHVLLDHQHRMHAQIAKFSHVYIYGKKAMKTSDRVRKQREWGYRAYGGRRLVWIDVNAKCHDRSSEAEAKAVAAEIKKFTEFASSGAGRGRKWKVAALVFYRNQEVVLRRHLQRLTGRREYRYFAMKGVEIELCTIDRYQGHEADVVFLSIANDHATPFLANPNRLNVAVTRARFLCVIVGNHEEMLGGEKPLSSLARMAGRQQGRGT